MAELQEGFEREIKSRLHTMAAAELVFVLRMFASAECASPEFYAYIDRHIGLHFSGAEGAVEPQLLFPILKSFYDSGHARSKLFIKMQQAILKALEDLNVNEVCAIVRLYVEMDVQQATFYEALARNIEGRLS
jgi:hypothetical protein